MHSRLWCRESKPMPLLTTEVFFRTDVRLHLIGLARAMAGAGQWNSGAEAEAYRRGFVDALVAVDSVLGPTDGPVWRIAEECDWDPSRG